LLAFLQETEWLEEKPQWANVLRAVGKDYDLDSVLEAAAAKADINELHFPIKTLMWLDPDGVKVSLGYRGQIKEITDND
jgi:hypothetical protein